MNNRYGNYGCPALMSDGRFITNYTNNTVLNQEIRNINKINSTHEYRSFLQKNTEKILKRKTEILLKENTCEYNPKNNKIQQKNTKKCENNNNFTCKNDSI